MADSYTKVWSSLLDSSVWGEPDHVRLVWITMLAMKDENGYVGASVDGIARRANVTLEQAAEAIKVLESPDPLSRNPDCEGRRIERVFRGWHVINHEYFRSLVDRDERRRYERERKKRQRERAQNGGSNRGSNVPPSPARSAHADADADAELEGHSDPLGQPRVDRETDLGFALFWDAYGKKTKKAKAQAAWKRLTKAQRAAAMDRVAAYVDSTPDRKFRRDAVTWLNQQGWEDEIVESNGQTKRPGRSHAVAKDRHNPSLEIGDPACGCTSCKALWRDEGPNARRGV